jgi:hypothetical protein
MKYRWYARSEPWWRKSTAAFADERRATNLLDVQGRLPEDRRILLAEIERYLSHMRGESSSSA